MLVLALVLSAFPSARLVEGALREDTFINAAMPRMTLPELRGERVRLQSVMPSKRAPIAFMIVTPALAARFAFFGGMTLGIMNASSTAFLVLYLTCGLVGGAALISGIVWLVVALRNSGVIQAELARVDARIRELTPPLTAPPVELLPPVPGVWLPVAPLRLARF